MSDSLSQDELDALLSDMGGESSSESSSTSSMGGEDAGLSNQEREAAAELATAFKSSAEGIGVMLGAQSSMGNTALESIDSDDAKARFSDNHIVLYSNFSGPVSGTVGLTLDRKDAASIVSTATGVDATTVMFNDDERDSLSELIGPVLIALGRTISGKVGSQVTTSPVQTTLTSPDQEFPVSGNRFALVHGPLQIPDIMDNDLGLLVPSEILKGMGITELEDARPSVSSSTPATAASGKSYSQNNLSLLMDVQMPLTVELGRTRMYVKEVLGMGEGSIIELDKLAGEPVDLMVNGKLIAKGEVVVIDENFGVRVTDIVSPGERLKMGN